MLSSTAKFCFGLLIVAVAQSCLVLVTTATDVEHRLPYPLVPFENSKRDAFVEVPTLDGNHIHHSAESENAPYLTNQRGSTLEPPTEKLMVSETRPPQKQSLVDKILGEVMLKVYGQTPRPDSPINSSSKVFSKQAQKPLKEGTDDEETGRLLEEARQEALELQRQLNYTEQQLMLVKEISRIIENGNSALKLENSVMGRLYSEERVKTRQLKAELLDIKQCAAKSNLTHDNATDSWDVHETIYNGERWVRNWDGRAEKESERNVKAARVLLFVRHGHYEYSVPEDQITMSDFGKQQMDAVGVGLALLRYNWTKTLIVSSKLRTVQAAQLIAAKMPGVFELAPTHLIWSCAYENDSARRQEAFKQIVHRASPEQKETSFELIVTHSSIIRYFVERAIQVPMGTISIPLVHGSITRIEIPPDGQVLLREFGEYSHMPRALLTNSNAKYVPGGALPKMV